MIVSIIRLNYRVIQVSDCEQKIKSIVNRSLFYLIWVPASKKGECFVPLHKKQLTLTFPLTELHLPEKIASSLSLFVAISTLLW